MSNSINRVEKALGKIYTGEKELRNAWKIAAFLEAKRDKLERVNPPSPLLGADEFD